MKTLLQEYKGYLTVIVFIFVIALFTIYGDRGLIHLSRLNQEVKRMEMVSGGLRDENKTLKRELFLLKNNRSTADSPSAKASKTRTTPRTAIVQKIGRLNERRAGWAALVVVGLLSDCKPANGRLNCLILSCPTTDDPDV